MSISQHKIIRFRDLSTHKLLFILFVYHLKSIFRIWYFDLFEMKDYLLVTLTFHRLNFNQRWAALKAKLNQIKTFNDKLRLAAFHNSIVKFIKMSLGLIKNSKCSRTFRLKLKCKIGYLLFDIHKRKWPVFIFSKALSAL